MGSLAEASGLGGHSAGHEATLWLAVLVIFAACLFGIFWALRRLSSTVELEEVERLLAEEDSEHAAPGS